MRGSDWINSLAPINKIRNNMETNTDWINIRSRFSLPRIPLVLITNRPILLAEIQLHFWPVRFLDSLQTMAESCAGLRLTKSASAAWRNATSSHAPTSQTTNWKPIDSQKIAGPLVWKFFFYQKLRLYKCFAISRWIFLVDAVLTLCTSAHA